MYGKNLILALIPARGGSKGLKRKNIRLLNEKPLIYYTIEAAVDSKYIDKTFISSEDVEILNLCSNKGATLINRPLELASDTSSAVDVVLHFINKQSISDDTFIVYLQPTSPLRTASILDSAISEMFNSNFESLISIVELEHSPYKSFKINNNGSLESLFPEVLSNVSRQLLPRTYLANGAIYIFRVSEFRKRAGFPSNGSFPFIMNKEDSVDIDTESDFQCAQQLLERRNGRI